MKKVNMNMIMGALKSPKTPKHLKAGLIKKYGHLLQGKRGIPLDAYTALMQSNPKKRAMKKAVSPYLTKRYEDQLKIYPLTSKVSRKEYIDTNLKAAYRNLKSNPKKKKWYFLPERGTNRALVISSIIAPSEESFGATHKYATGPFRTKKEAIHGAQYQGFIPGGVRIKPDYSR